MTDIPEVTEADVDVMLVQTQLRHAFGCTGGGAFGTPSCAECDAPMPACNALASLRSQHERDEAEKLCLARMCVLLKVGGTLAEIEADPDCLNGILEWAQRQAVSDISAREEAGQ